MSRGMSRREAEAHLEHEVREALRDEAKVSPRMIERALLDGAAKLNRAARRALGQRSDARYHPLAARKDVVRSRNAK